MPLARLALTPGEPAGIGPELSIQYAQLPHDFQLIALADPALLEQRARQLKLPVKLIEYQNQSEPSGSGRIYYQSTKLIKPSACGLLNPANAAYVLKTLDEAVTGCLNGRFDALVTGPVHKGIINESGIPFTGHTEYLADKTSTEKVVMMLATEEMRVALATTHLPLKAVAQAITRDSLTQVLKILNHDMQTRFGISKPHILVCGLNPHAGEGGHLGTEELDTIIPVLQQLNDQGMNLTGPLPADTLFARKNLQQADAVLAMYHDQGLPVLKYQGFGRAVNITLGLPIIRTSVDHGTALELAGTGQADTGSLHYAIQVALQMASTNNQAFREDK